MKTKTGVAWVVGALVVAGGGALAFDLGQPKKVSSFITAPVEVADIESSVMASGTLEPAEVVDVNPQTPGQLITMTAKLGDTVKKGQLLGTIDSLQLNNALRQAQTQLLQATTQRSTAQANVITAENNQVRQHALQDQGVSSEKDVEDADNQVRTTTIQANNTELTIQNAQLQVDAANNNLQKANVTAPIDGIVAEVVLSQGATLSTTNQLPVILRIAKMDVMTVRAEISEADIIKVSEGQTAYFTILGDPNHRYYGKLRAVEFTPSTGSLDPGKGGPSKDAIYYNALFDVPNTDGRLLPGMTANVHVVLGAAKGVETIPVAALGKQVGTDRYVVEVQDAKGQVQPREITTGLTDQSTIEVKSGLSKTDKVVVGDAASATPGASAATKGPMFDLPSSLKS